MSESHTPQGPAAMMQMFQAASVTGLVAAGIRLGAFAALSHGPLSAAAVGERLQCPARSTRVLLDGLAVIGLVKKDGETYSLLPLARDHLVPGQPMYMGDVVGIFASPMIWGALPRLADAVRAGGTVMESHAETPANTFWETFAESSGSLAFPASMALGALAEGLLARRPKPRVLDIACGSGIYGYSLLKNPSVELTLLDWPNVLEKTRAWGKKVGADMARVRFIEGNLFEADYGGPYDLIVLSHVYHHFNAETCIALTRKASAALSSEGHVAVQDFLGNPDLSNPAAAMFSVTMLMWTRNGEAHTADDYRRFFGEGGLKAPEIHATPGMPTNWLIAQKA
jgi:C-methyltransferase